jgi:RNA-dependent RNA polymerase
MDDIFTGQAHLSFPVRYQLEVCLSNGYIKEHNITIDFLKKLEALESQKAVYILEKVADRQQIYYDPMEIFDIPIRGLKRKIPSYCVLQRAVTITPSMMHVATPVMETSNRIIRKYEADIDRFIRVKFTDEKTEGQLRTLPNGRAEALFDRVSRAMNNGIVVAGRYYEFLAFGNSQFRENGAYFYAPTASKSADDIRLSLGQFDHIKTVSKFAARLGQCFSTTRAMGVAVKLVMIPDIKRNGFVFTDGVGKLSPFLAIMAAQELGLANPFADPPSLFQFRLGGSKGVLAVDPNLNGSEVHIRPSQYKFQAPYTGLEIIRSSSFATPYFNRQIILVLSYLGVRDTIFLNKQRKMMADYARAMTDEDIALQKLRKNIDINQTTLAMAAMILDGFMGPREPFIMSLLALWRACTIKNLKEKARIAIDDGAFLLGCVDETASLKGHMNDPQSRRDVTRQEKLATLPEIFLQINDTAKKGHYIIVEGVCILARNPSLHPGDVRVVRAVNAPALHHLKNVVVFPQTGDRDLANMCSGGDLDGDDYMVLWDKDLIPEIINNPPMDYTPERPLETDKPITAADMSEFFVNYMKNDALGQIAHAHLAQADFNDNGVGDDMCLELAELHSRAVDFPKSGIAAEMKRELRPRKWPHFMEKKHLSQHQIYLSKDILGRLYDEVQVIDFKPQWENPFDKRILGAFDLDQELLDKAASLKLSYDEALRRLMAKHGVRSEFEVWSVFILVHNHESGDYKFAEEFGKTVAALKYQFRVECRAAAELRDSNDWARLGPFIAAMYTITAREMESALDECSKTKTVGGREVPCRTKDPEHMPLISFPWLFPSELGKIATGSSTSHQLDGVQSQHRQNKYIRSAQAEAKIGAVETEKGTTLYGELLDLDFSLTALQMSDPSPTAKETK